MENKGVVFMFFTMVLFLTPHIPMPTSALGPIGPIAYLGLFIAFLFFIKNKSFLQPKNNYFKYFIFLSGILLLSDILLFILYDKSGYKTIMVRVVNIAIFILTIAYMVDQDDKKQYFRISPFFNRVYIYSVLFLSLVLYGQAFGFIRFGEVFRSRTYFGIQLPFLKPVGLFQLSDGKLGIIIAPLIFYYLINRFKEFRFNKVKYTTLLIALLIFILFVMQSRSGYLALVIALFFLVVLFNTRKSKLLLKSGIIFASILFFFTNIFQFIWAGLAGEGIFAQNVESRGNTMSFGFEKFLTSPLYGVGRSNLTHLNNPLKGGTGVGIHNLFFEHLGGGGLLAFIPLTASFLLYFYYCFKLFFLAKKQGVKDQIGFSLWLIVSMIYIIVELNFYRGLYNEYVYFFFGFGAIAYLNYKKLSYEKNITHCQC